MILQLSAFFMCSVAMVTVAVVSRKVPSLIKKIITAHKYTLFTSVYSAGIQQTDSQTLFHLGQLQLPVFTTQTLYLFAHSPQLPIHCLRLESQKQLTSRNTLRDIPANEKGKVWMVKVLEMCNFNEFFFPLSAAADGTNCFWTNGEQV